MAQPLQAGGGGPPHAAPQPNKQGNYWLVRITNQGRGSQWSLQNLPLGQRPIEANWHAAVYLGNTVAQANRNLKAASQALGIPDITRVPSLQDSIGIISAIVSGFAIGGAASGVTGAAEVGAAETVAGGATAAETGAAAAGGSTLANVLKKAGSAVKSGLSGGGALKKGLAALSLTALFTNSSFWAGMGMIIAGGVLVLLGVLGMAGVSGSSVKRTAMRVAG